MDNRFTLAPQVKQSRSKFKRDHTHKTTFNTGSLVPIMVDEVLPGDTFNIKMSSLVRSSTPMVPVMDNAYLDTYAFFVPNRLVWDHWEEFMGENKTDQWTESRLHRIPEMWLNQGHEWTRGSLGDHMGLPTYTDNISVNHLPFRAYALIWNEFFRDQGIQDPIHIDKGSVGPNTALWNNQTISAQVLTGRTMLSVNKYHDYFTSCLKDAQKGADTTIPLFLKDALLPVVTGPSEHDDQTNRNPIRFRTTYGAVPNANQGLSIFDGKLATEAGVPSGSERQELKPSNLWLKTNNTALGNINDLRRAFQIQRALERDARSGTRYTEMIEAHFGVTNPDARLQRPEFLGGQHVRLQQQQVAQTSGTGTTGSQTPQGNVSAYSLTTANENLAMKSFTEHGYIFILGCVRTEQTYQNNIERMWNRRERFNFYHPVFANLGEQEVLKQELVAQGTDHKDQHGATIDSSPFGFQEAWAEYRMKPNKVTGDFKSNSPKKLDMWHYANDFGTTTPSLNEAFIGETTKNVDRTLAVKMAQADQFIGDFYIENETTRVMPLYSVPGLIDHN